ncbi:hypothetical protein ACEZCY_30885 [Streptacidiphilus sp. N1-12]|uniref:Uncharacterized protein n=2 Tax=Streptacidiphilus alkalitolerans TaxID=3342712 RepID=A0ABV6VI22_9ACTN
MSDETESAEVVEDVEASESRIDGIVLKRPRREAITLGSGNATYIEGIRYVAEAVAPVVAAAAVVAKAKITKGADVRKAEIQAETDRQRIAAETRQVETREGAETLREAIRQQNPTPPPTT